VAGIMGEKGSSMMGDKQAELYTSPGGKFLRADTLPSILAHWRSFRAEQKRKHLIKYDGVLYAGIEIDKLQILRMNAEGSTCDDTK
jgi:hypothetical protein